MGGHRAVRASLPADRPTIRPSLEVASPEILTSSYSALSFSLESCAFSENSFRGRVAALRSAHGFASRDCENNKPSRGMLFFLNRTKNTHGIGRIPSLPNGCPGNALWLRPYRRCLFSVRDEPKVPGTSTLSLSDPSGII